MVPSAGGPVEDCHGGTGRGRLYLCPPGKTRVQILHLPLWQDPCHVSHLLWFVPFPTSQEISLGTFIFQRAFRCNRVCEREFKSVINFPLSSKHLFHHFKWFLNGCNALDLPAEITSVLSSKPEFLFPLALCSLQIIQWEFIWKEVVGHKWSKMLTAGVPIHSLLM